MRAAVVLILLVCGACKEPVPENCVVGDRCPEGQVCDTATRLCVMAGTADMSVPAPDLTVVEPPPSVPQLHALSPSVAQAGSTLYLEGAFPPDMGVQVQFPGDGQLRDATVLGTTRAVVTVPSSATAGDLSLRIGGTPTRSLPFRRVTFALGLLPFRRSYEQTNFARQMAALTEGRAGHALITTRSYVYAVGGRSSMGVLERVEQAMINADGTLAPFDEVPQERWMRRARTGHAGLLIGRYAYVMGGRDATQALQDVERASIDDQQRLGAFQAVAGQRLTVPREDACAVLVGHWLYVIGGKGLKSVERSRIDADGNLLGFQPYGEGLKAARAGATCTLSGDSLYVVGGKDADALATVEQARVTGDGSLGPFAAAGQLFKARSHHSAVVLGERLYVFGGRGTEGDVLTSEQAQLSGAALSFATVTDADLNNPRVEGRAVVIGNHIYQIGGGNGAGSALPRRVERAAFNAGGVFQTLENTGQALSTPNQGIAVALGKYLYLFPNGSTNGTTQVLQRAEVKADGTLGAFELQGMTLGRLHCGGQIAVTRGFVFLLSGSNCNTGIDNQFDVAPIGEGGLVGAFAISTSQINFRRTGFTAAFVDVASADNEQLCIFGGDTGSNTITDSVACAPVQNNGAALGATMGVTTLRVRRSAQASIVLGKNVYQLGGYDGAGYISSAEAAPLPLGDFAAPSVTLAASGTAFSAVVLGARVYLIGGNDAGGSIDKVQSATVSALGTLGNLSSSGTLAQKLYWPGTAVLGNYLYVLGGYRADNTYSGTIYRAELR